MTKLEEVFTELWEKKAAKIEINNEHLDMEQVKPIAWDFFMKGVEHICSMVEEKIK
jgi:hypothetical protein